MDFWKTQTAMHHSLQDQGGREGERGRIWSEAWGERKERKTSKGQGASQETVEFFFLTKSLRASISGE